MLIATLFTVARTWKQPECSLTDEWIKEMRYTYTMDTVVVVQSLSHVCFFATPWTVAHQASLSSSLPGFAQIHVH